MLRRCAALCLLLLWGCGPSGGGGLEGLYEMRSQEERRYCEAGEWRAVTSEAPYYLLEKGELFGVTYLAWKLCSAPDVASCEEDYDGFMGVFALRDGQWASQNSTTSYQAPDCHLWVSEGVLEETERGLEWTLVDRSVDLVVDSEDECMVEKILSGSEALSCDMEVRYVADRYPAPPEEEDASGDTAAGAVSDVGSEPAGEDVPDVSEDEPSPGFCYEAYCCTAPRCPFSQFPACDERCTEELDADQALAFRVWWASALCAADCDVDPNCAEYDTCNACRDACAGDLDNVTVLAACAVCIRAEADSDSCPGVAVALNEGCL